MTVRGSRRATGQAKANSGVYIQGRYEIQVLDSYGVEVPGKGDCVAIYNQFAPLVSACRPALAWQSYDVVKPTLVIQKGIGSQAGDNLARSRW
jgi:hypothetical protein